MLARIDTDVNPYSSDWVLMDHGVNDIFDGTLTTLAITIADVTRSSPRSPATAARVMVMLPTGSGSGTTTTLGDFYALPAGSRSTPERTAASTPASSAPRRSAEPSQTRWNPCSTARRRRLLHQRGPIRASADHRTGDQGNGLATSWSSSTTPASQRRAPPPARSTAVTGSPDRSSRLHGTARAPRAACSSRTPTPASSLLGDLVYGEVVFETDPDVAAATSWRWSPTSGPPRADWRLFVPKPRRPTACRRGRVAEIRCDADASRGRAGRGRAPPARGSTCRSG